MSKLLKRVLFGGAGWSDAASTPVGVCTWAYPMVRKRRLVTGTLHHPSRPCIMAVSPQHLPLLTRADKWSLKLSARVGGGLSHDVWRTTGCPFRPPKNHPKTQPPRWQSTAATTTRAHQWGHTAPLTLAPPTLPARAILTSPGPVHPSGDRPPTPPAHMRGIMLQRGGAQAHPHCERHLLRVATTTPLRTYLSHTHCNDSNTHGWRALPCATATHTSLHARSWSPRTCASNGGRGDTIGGAGRVPRHGVYAGPPSPTSHVHTPTSSTRPRPQTRRPWPPARKTPTIGRPGGVHMDCMPVAPLAHMGHANQHMRTHHTPALTCPTPRTPYKPTLPPQAATPGLPTPYTHTGLLARAFRVGWVQVPHMGVSSRLVATHPSPKPGPKT